MTESIDGFVFQPHGDPHVAMRLERERKEVPGRYLRVRVWPSGPEPDPEKNAYAALMFIEGTEYDPPQKVLGVSSMQATAMAFHGIRRWCEDNHAMYRDHEGI